MSDDKPFLDVDKQIALLESRGMIMDGKPRKTLMREGYYQLVNGYKDIFIDVDATRRAGSDRFKRGTTFSMLHVLFQVDRLLRHSSFMTLIQAESMFKNAVVYAFCERNDGPEAYLRRDAYCKREEYYRPSIYDDKLEELIGTLKHARKNAWGDASISHYLGKYGHVPLWVLANTLTFGNISHFFAMQKRGVQEAAARIVADVRGQGRIRPERLGSVAATLVPFRNICAHDNRLYCACTGGKHKRYFADMLAALSVLVDDITISQLISSVTTAMKVFELNPEMQKEVMDKMRIEFMDGGIRPKGGWRR